MARPLLPAVRRIGPLASLDELRQAVDDLQEFVQTREPLESGDPLNKYLTLRAAVETGLLVYRGPGGGGSGGGVGVPPDTPAPPPDWDDLTPPDPITGLTVTSLPTGFFVEFDAPSYSQGGGNAYSIIYRANYDGTPPLPTFGDAAEVGRTTERSPILVLAAEPGTISHFWAQPVSHAEDFNGVAPQTAPTGGTNGVSATAGTMGNQHLGDLIITAEKLSQGTYPGINLIPNAGAEDGVVAWAANESSGAGGAFSVDTSQKYSGSQSFKIGKAATGDGYNIVCLAMPVIPGETYAFKARVKGSSATATGLYLRLNESITKPAGNYVTAAVRTSLTNIVSNGAVATAWTQYEDTYTVPAGIYWVSVALYNWTTGPLSMWFDDLSFGRQITAALLAAECIAVGTAAIQDAAIVTAMIDNLAVTNAKIASLSADKLIANSLAVGVELKSTGFVSGSFGFYLEAGGDAEFNNIVARGTIYASGGLIGGAVIASTYVESTNYDGAGLGWRLSNSAGKGYFGKLLVSNVGATRVFDTEASGTDPILKIGSSLSLLGNGTGTLGALVIASSGYIRQGQTAYATGTGFWLGDDSGTTKFSIGSSTKYLRWTGSALELSAPTFDAFSVSIGSDITADQPAAGAFTIGTPTATPSGGKTPYSYNWMIQLQSQSTASSIFISSGLTSATVTVQGFSGGGDYASPREYRYARLTCFVSDANGRVTTDSIEVEAGFSADIVTGE